MCVLLASLGMIALVGRVYVPWAGPAPGRPVGRRSLPLLARLRLHAGAALVVLAAVVAGRLTGTMPASVAAFVLVAAAALVGRPVAYTMTAGGIVVGRGRFRRWTEFGGVSRRRGGARLQGVAGGRGMSVWFAGGGDGDEVVLQLKRLVRGAYQGQVEPEEAEGVALFGGGGVRSPGPV